jgi:ATP-dependent exoDNAse (exonuclease V) alpha subunit
VLFGPAGLTATQTSFDRREALQALAAAADGWRQGGVPVLGTALAAIAACRPESGTGIPTTTLHRLLRDCDQPESGLPAGAVVVVDEAAMVGTRQLATLLGRVANAGGKLVLVGNPRQLPEIDAGGLFAALARREPITLTGNQRQAEPWEREALLALRDGRVGPALDAYLTHRRIHVASDADGVRARISRDYRTARAAAGSPYDVVVLTTRRTDAAALNERIRTDLRAAGRLGTDSISVTGDHGRREYVDGELVLVTRNDHRRGLLNGARGTLTATDQEHLTLRTENARTVTVPTSWAAAHLDHGYALTVHKAQGLTVDTALLDGAAALCQQAGYTGLSAVGSPTISTQRWRRRNRQPTSRSASSAPTPPTSSPGWWTDYGHDSRSGPPASNDRRDALARSSSLPPGVNCSKPPPNTSLSASAAADHSDR